MVRRIFWTCLQALALTLLAGALPLGYLFACPQLGWFVFCGIVLLHLVELGITIPLARKKGFPLPRAMRNTLLFGFTWWLPWKCSP